MPNAHTRTYTHSHPQQTTRWRIFHILLYFFSLSVHFIYVYLLYTQFFFQRFESFYHSHSFFSLFFSPQSRSSNKNGVISSIAPPSHIHHTPISSYSGKTQVSTSFQFSLSLSLSTHIHQLSKFLRYIFYCFSTRQLCSLARFLCERNNNNNKMDFCMNKKRKK